MRGVVKLSAISAPLVVPWNQIDAKRKLQLCAMSIVHVDVGWVTESLPRNDAYALIIVKLFFIKFLGHATYGPAAAAPAAPAPTALVTDVAFPLGGKGQPFKILLEVHFDNPNGVNG